MSTLVSRLYNWVTDKANSVKITASRMDAEFDQVVTALNRKVLCSASAPANPINGQTWVDTTNKLPKIYLDSEWKTIALLTAADIIGTIYPVGSIYVSTLSTNPGTLLGVGTWAVFGAGRTLVSLNSADADFDTSEETGGEKTHTLTIPEMPAHTHTYDRGITVNEGDGLSQRLNGYTSEATGSTGGGSAHNNLQPYIVVYMWKRTA